MKKILLSIICLLFTLTLCGKNEKIIINGTVLDTETAKPIPFVNIYVDGTYLGTMSNEDGAFEIKVETLPVNLVFSQLAYHSRTINVNQPQIGVVKLSPSPIELEEASVSMPQSEVRQITALSTKYCKS